MSGRQINWDFFLIDTATRQKIEVLNAARDRRVELVHNRPGSLGFSIPLDDPKAAFIEKQKTAIRAVRNGIEIWSGPVYTRQLDAASNRMTVGCLGWMEDLYRRLIRVGQEMEFDEVAVNTIIYALLNAANKQRTGIPAQNGDGTNGDLGTAIRPTRVSEGTATLTDTDNFPSWPEFSIEYASGVKIGDAIQQLSDIENGVDLEVDASTGALNLYYPRKGVDRPHVIFGFGKPPHNLRNMTRNEDTADSVQRFSASGTTATRFAEDLDAMDDLGIMFEEEESLSDVTDSDVLLAYAGAEVAIRSRGLITDSIDLFPRTPQQEKGENVPQLFVDYNIGDTVRVSCNQGLFQINKQKMRVYGATVSIDNEGNERIESVSTSPVGS